MKTSNCNIESYYLWLFNGGRETFDKNGLENAEDFLEIVEMLNLAPLSKYTKFLRSLPKKFITDNILVVHAGINWEVHINEQDDHDLLWIRDPYIYPSLISDIDNIEKDNLKRVIITGHTPTTCITGKSECNIISYEYPCKRYFIDGGSKMGRKKGQINVLILDEFGDELNRYILK